MIDRRHPSSSFARGFSLIEAAVVLVIIGLILGAVLQGRQLIASAEYKSFRSDLTEYGNAFYTFRDRYGALPGDYDDAPDRLDVPSSSNSGNGVIDDGPGCDAAADESCLVWQHLRAAGLITGNPDTSGEAAGPDHPYGGRMESVFTGTDTAGADEFGHKILITGVPLEVAIRLDREADDENCDKGRIRATSNADCDGNDWAGDNDVVNIAYGL